MPSKLDGFTTPKNPKSFHLRKKPKLLRKPDPYRLTLPKTGRTLAEEIEVMGRRIQKQAFPVIGIKKLAELVASHLSTEHGFPRTRMPIREEGIKRILERQGLLEPRSDTRIPRPNFGARTHEILQRATEALDLARLQDPSMSVERLKPIIRTRLGSEGMNLRQVNEALDYALKAEALRQRQEDARKAREKHWKLK